MRRNALRFKSPFTNFPGQTAFLDFGLFLFGISASYIGLFLIYHQEPDARLAPKQNPPSFFKVSDSQPVGPREIIVWVNQQELVFINGKHAHLEDLRHVLKQAQDETPLAGVYLVGHPDARFGTLADVHKTLSECDEQESDLLASNHLYVTR